MLACGNGETIDMAKPDDCMSDCSSKDSSSYRDILGSILDSTECKIDSARSRDLRK